MPFDITGFQQANKEKYGDRPLSDMVKEAYDTEYSDKYPDFDTFVKEHKLDKAIAEDTEGRREKPFAERLAKRFSEDVARITPKGYEDISTGFVKGATWGYTPAVETPEDAGTAHKIARGAAELAGMGVGLIGPGKLVGGAIKGAGVAAGVARGATLGGIWGVGRKQEEGEDRVTSALKDAAIFGTFSAGGELIKGLAGKLSKPTSDLLKNMKANPAYVPNEAEKKILTKLGYISSTALGGGAGASEPAENWEQRLGNILTGAATFGLAHGASHGAGKVKELLAGKGEGAGLTEAELKKIEGAVPVSEKIHKGLETGTFEGKPFSTLDAVTAVEMGRKDGIFDREDMDMFAKKFSGNEEFTKGIAALKTKEDSDIAMSSITEWTKTGVDHWGKPYTPKDTLEDIKRSVDKDILSEDHLAKLRVELPTLSTGITEIQTGKWGESVVKNSILSRLEAEGLTTRSISVEEKPVVETAKIEPPIQTQAPEKKVAEKVPIVAQDASKGVQDASKTITTGDTSAKQSDVEPEKKGSIFERMPEDALKQQADMGVKGAKTELDRRIEEQHLKNITGEGETLSKDAQSFVDLMGGEKTQEKVESDKGVSQEKLSESVIQETEESKKTKFLELGNKDTDLRSERRQELEKTKPNKKKIENLNKQIVANEQEKDAIMKTIGEKQGVAGEKGKTENKYPEKTYKRYDGTITKDRFVVTDSKLSPSDKDSYYQVVDLETGERSSNLGFKKVGKAKAAKLAAKLNTEKAQSIKQVGSGKEAATEVKTGEKGQTLSKDAQSFAGLIPKEGATTETAPKAKSAKRVAREAISEARIKELDTEKADAIKKLNEQLGGIKMGAAVAFNPEIYKQLAVIGRIQIEKGYINIKDFSKNMIEDCGDIVKPYMQKLWNDMQSHPVFKEVEEEMKLSAEKKKAEEKIAAEKVSRPSGEKKEVQEDTSLVGKDGAFTITQVKEKKKVVHKAKQSKTVTLAEIMAKDEQAESELIGIRNAQEIQRTKDLHVKDKIESQDGKLRSRIERIEEYQKIIDNEAKRIKEFSRKVMGQYGPGRDTAAGNKEKIKTFEQETKLSESEQVNKIARAGDNFKTAQEAINAEKEIIKGTNESVRRKLDKPLTDAEREEIKANIKAKGSEVKVETSDKKEDTRTHEEKVKNWQRIRGDYQLQEIETKITEKTKLKEELETAYRDSRSPEKIEERKKKVQQWKEEKANAEKSRDYVSDTIYNIADKSLKAEKRLILEDLNHLKKIFKADREIKDMLTRKETLEKAFPDNGERAKRFYIESKKADDALKNDIKQIQLKTELLNLNKKFENSKVFREAVEKAEDIGMPFKPELGVKANAFMTDAFLKAIEKEGILSNADLKRKEALEMMIPELENEFAEREAAALANPALKSEYKKKEKTGKEIAEKSTDVEEIEDKEDLSINDDQKKLVDSVTKQVFAIANKHATDEYVKEDLAQQGMMGAIEAAKKFSAEKGVKFITFATPYIKGRVLRYKTKNVGDVKVVTNDSLVALKDNYNKVDSALTTELGRNPTSEEIANRFNEMKINKGGWKVSDIEDWKVRRQDTARLNAPVGEGDATLGDITASKEDIEGDLITADSNAKQTEILERELNKLPADKQFIMRNIKSDNPLTNAELAEKFGKSAEWVRLKEKEAKNALKEVLTGKKEVEKDTYSEPEVKGTVEEVGVENVKSVRVSEEHTIKDINGKEHNLKENEFLRVENNKDKTFHITDGKEFDVSVSKLEDIKGEFSSKINIAAGGTTPQMREEGYRIRTESTEKEPKREYGDINKQVGEYAQRVSQNLPKIKTMFEEIRKSYMSPREFTEATRIVGEYTGKMQLIEHELTVLAKDLNSRLSPESQIAITNYIQSGGSIETLKKWESGARPEHKQGYSDALKLTPAEKQEAAKFHQRMDALFKEAEKYGVIDTYVENWVHQTWEKPEKAGAKIMAQVNAGAFRLNPSEAKKRIFESYYEGESKGFKPRDKRIGYLLTSSELSIRQAIEARKVMIELSKGYEKDGRKTIMFAGSGKIMERHTYAVMGNGDKAIRVFEKESEANEFLANNSSAKRIEKRDNLTFAIKPDTLQRYKYAVVGEGGKVIRAFGSEKEATTWMEKTGKGLDVVSTPNTNTSDYKVVDSPALRQYKYIGKDPSGNPAIMQGDMWVHPDAYGRINALVGRSAIREYTVPEGVPVIGGTKPGDALLKAGAFIKGSILIGPFHHVHVAIHAVFHKVNPLAPRELDFEKRPLLKEGVNHGLMLVSHKAMAEFGEGLASGGLWHQIPGIGTKLTQYQEFLFQSYIPRLKAEMYEHAVKRAEKYYAADLASGKYTRDQLLDNAALQANAAFGEMNYKYMGRNPTLQDAFRFVLLAPDFLEARARFAQQALMPKGREQVEALARGAAIMAIGAQIANMMFSDDKQAHWDRPFSVFVGGREYAPRSVHLDVMHFLTDPRGFWYNRLNPLTGSPIVKVITGRDIYGKKTDLAETAGSVVKSWLPIPAQQFTARNEGATFIERAINTVLASSGITNKMYKSDLEKWVMKLDKPEMPKMTKEQLAHNDITNKLTADIHDQEPGATQRLQEALRNKEITHREYQEVLRDAKTDKLVHNTKTLTVKQMSDAFSHATVEEKKILLPIFANKIKNARRDLRPEEMDNYIKQYRLLQKEVSKF